jgi:hypothetical protein
MANVKHTFPPFTTPFGLTVTEVLVDGAGCEWTKPAKGDWHCTPVKGGDCDRPEWTDDGCRSTASIHISGKRATIIYKCVCQNSIADLLAER